MPPIPSSHDRAQENSTQGIRGLAGSEEAGMTSQTRLTQCMNRTRMATRDDLLRLRLFSRNSSTKNGRKKLKETQGQRHPLPAAPRPPQVPGDLFRSGCRSR